MIESHCREIEAQEPPQSRISHLLARSSLGSRQVRAIRTLARPAVIEDIFNKSLLLGTEVGEREAPVRLHGVPVDRPRRVTRPRRADPRTRRSVSERQLGTELWTAIGTNGIDVCYQPKVEMASGIVRGAEAMVRWYHPRFGRVRPSELVAVAERTGAIQPLTMWVLRRALEQCRAWRAEGWDLTIAVNLSAFNLMDSQLTADVARLLDEVGLPASALVLEITETLVVGESQQSVDVVESLSALGVKISCDDFGTGYASLSRLRNLPISEIKVDRSFVARMAEDDTDRAITRSVLALGRRLGMTTVAEGVEDRDCWDVLRAFGCDQMQGFLVSRPLTADRFRQWMSRQPPALQLHTPPPETPSMAPAAGCAVDEGRGQRRWVDDVERPA